MQGEYFLKFGNNLSRNDVVEYPDLAKHNLIVDNASILIAQWAFAGTTPHVNGLMTLAMGGGLSSWDTEGTPGPLPGQEALVTELMRKEFDEKRYMINGTESLLVPTNVIEFETVFTELELLPPPPGNALREMGLFNSTVLGPEMFNYTTFSVINKPANSQLTIVWRITF